MAATEFFEHQEDARRRSKRLVVIFVAAVAAIVASVHAAVSLVVWQSLGGAKMTAVGDPGYVDGYLTDPTIFGVVATAVVALVAAGSLYRINALQGGGGKVARSLGGRPIDPSTTDAGERRVLNVVEEMAIASGVPVPPVYLLGDEEGINAFAAGYEPTGAVIGVTRGTVEHLTRAELQGVIAHEFSHILNGDMRLNVRLIGLLHGVLLIGIVGRVLLGSRRGRGRSRNGGGQIALLGLALLAIGYIGTLCGNLIKAAVSREREFLADASAVQFTRNPGGLAGALKKIGGLQQGSRIHHPRGEELSHMYFGSGIRNRLGSLFATHPPLVRRIRRIQPSFDGSFPAVEIEAEAAAATGPEAPEVAGLAGETAAGAGPPDAAAPETGAPAPPAGEALSPDAPDVVSLDEALARVGEPTSAHLEYVQELMAGVPPSLTEAARDPGGARALLHVLLLDPDPEIRSRQEALLDDRVDDAVRSRIAEIAPDATRLDPHARLPLLEVLIGTLRGLDGDAYRELRETVDALAGADERTGLFEWVAGSLVLRQLDPHFDEERRRGRYTKLSGVSDALVHLLSALAHVGHDDREEAETAFDAGIASLEDVGPRSLLGPDAAHPAVLDASLERLSHLVPPLKKQVLEACARTIAADRRVTVTEGELFRVIADWMDCPIPPLLPGQKVA